MTTNRRARPAVRALALALALLCPSLTAEGRPPSGRTRATSNATQGHLVRLRRVVLRARILVGEAGWNAPVEHAALAWTLERRAERLGRARGWSWREVAERYTRGGYSTAARSRRERWVAALDLAGERPETFPVHLPWASYRRRWRRVLALSAAFERGEVPDPCDGPSEHWAAPHVERLDLAEIDCGPTRNRFWSTR